MGRVKLKYKLKPLFVLDGNWTKICNTMIFHIPDAYTFKIYVYLCYKCNNEHQYAFSSLNTIAKDTSISRRKVQESIKWLEEKGFIVKYKRQGDNWRNNCYYVRYIEENKIEEEKKITSIIERETLKELGKEIEVEVVVDENEEVDESKKEHKRKIDYAYKKWREKVLKRDGYTCQLCGKTEDEAILNVHHIKRYSENEELKTEVNNGITLCCDCHRKIFNKENEFEDYFKAIIKTK